MRGGRLDDVKKALKAGGDPGVVMPQDDPDYESGTLVAVATVKGHAHLIPVLVEAGVDVNGRGRREGTPLHLAAEMNQVEVLKMLLLHGASIEASTADEYSEWHTIILTSCIHLFIVPIYIP